MAFARKRSNPFGPITPQQLKTFIGFKEAASASELKLVYERTQQCLLRAARRPATKPRAGICRVCERDKAENAQCAFCDKTACRNCVRLCCACGDIYCSTCSTINYDERDDRVFCLNCALMTST